MLFFLLNGETYDYIGSQRLLYDMENDEFPFKLNKNNKWIKYIKPENISLFVELSQMGHKGAVHAHILEKGSAVIIELLFYTSYVFKSKFSDRQILGQAFRQQTCEFHANDGRRCTSSGFPSNVPKILSRHERRRRNRSRRHIREHILQFYLRQQLQHRLRIL